MSTAADVEHAPWVAAAGVVATLANNQVVIPLFPLF